MPQSLRLDKTTASVLSFHVNVAALYIYIAFSQDRLGTTARFKRWAAAVFRTKLKRWTAAVFRTLAHHRVGAVPVEGVAHLEVDLPVHWQRGIQCECVHWQRFVAGCPERVLVKLQRFPPVVEVIT